MVPIMSHAISFYEGLLRLPPCAFLTLTPPPFNHLHLSLCVMPPLKDLTIFKPPDKRLNPCDCEFRVKRVHDLCELHPAANLVNHLVDLLEIIV